MFNGVGTDVTVAVVEFSTSVFTPFSGIADILGLRLGTNDVSTAVTFDRLPLLLLLALILPALLLLFAQLLLLLILLDTAILTAGIKVLLLLLLLLLMVVDETDEGVAFDEILVRLIVGALVLDGATDILGVVDADEDGDGTAAVGVALRDGVEVVGAGLVDAGAVVEVAVVLLLSVVETVVVGRDVGDDSEPAASFSCSVSSFTIASVLSVTGSVEFTFDVLLVSFVVLLILPLLLLLLVVLVILLILVAVVDVVVAVAEDTVAAAGGGDAADVVTVLITGAVATDDTVAVVFVVDALCIAVLVLMLPALQLLLLLLLLLLLVLFEDEFVETLDAELFPIELFVEFAARSRPTVFCCCSRCSLVVTPVVSASTMHCVGF